MFEAVKNFVSPTIIHRENEVMEAFERGHNRVIRVNNRLQDTIRDMMTENDRVTQRQGRNDKNTR